MLFPIFCYLFFLCLTCPRCSSRHPSILLLIPTYFYCYRHFILTQYTVSSNIDTQAFPTSYSLSQTFYSPTTRLLWRFFLPLPLLLYYYRVLFVILILNILSSLQLQTLKHTYTPLIIHILWESTSDHLPTINSYPFYVYVGCLYRLYNPLSYHFNSILCFLFF